MNTFNYETVLPRGSHWSLQMRRGTTLRLTDLEGSANVGMLFYNPENLLERYNAPDTLKCQHTFKLTSGNCLFSDMGRIFASITEDSVGWHESICGNSNSTLVKYRWGVRDYQGDRNNWHQNGYDAFLVELAKYGLGPADMASNVNWFSKVQSDEKGSIFLAENNSNPGSQVTLRFEMDTLVILHNCPHPLDQSTEYPSKPVGISLAKAAAVAEDDLCKNHRLENRRGFMNNELYYLGSE